MAEEQCHINKHCILCVYPFKETYGKKLRSFSLIIRALRGNFSFLFSPVGDLYPEF